MSYGKISGANLLNVVRSNDAADPLQDPALNHASHGHFKGALFRHGGLNILMRRGPTSRMPLRNSGTKRGSKSNRAARAESVTDADALQEEDEFQVEESNTDQLVRRFKSFQNNQEHESGREGSSERRFARMFQMPIGKVSGKAAPSDGIRTAESMQAKLAAVPLPAMRTLGDMVGFIHSCVEKDPTGKSISQILRRINAAVLRKEIDLPMVTKVADARRVLIEIFGTTQMSKENVSPSMRNIHLMLPLWLVNLGRQRSGEQQVQAAARVASQRSVLDMK